MEQLSPWYQVRSIGSSAASSLLERGVMPETPEPLQVIFDDRTLFLENGARFGVGVVPLPEPPR
jgi:hypothetical protein